MAIELDTGSTPSEETGTGATPTGAEATEAKEGAGSEEGSGLRDVLGSAWDSIFARKDEEAQSTEKGEGKGNEEEGAQAKEGETTKEDLAAAGEEGAAAGEGDEGPSEEDLDRLSSYRELEKKHAKLLGDHDPVKVTEEMYGMWGEMYYSPEDHIQRTLSLHPHLKDLSGNDLLKALGLEPDNSGVSVETGDKEAKEATADSDAGDLFKEGEFDDEATKTTKAAARKMLASSEKNERELRQRLDQIDQRATDSVRRGNMSTLNSFVNERGSEGAPAFPHMENDQVRFNMKRLLATDDQIAGNRMTRDDLARNYAIAVRMVEGLKDPAPTKKPEAKADEGITPAAKPEAKTRDHKGRFVPETKVEKNPTFSAEETKPDLIALGGREGIKLKRNLNTRPLMEGIFDGVMARKDQRASQ